MSKPANLVLAYQYLKQHPEIASSQVNNAISYPWSDFVNEDVKELYVAPKDVQPDGRCDIFYLKLFLSGSYEEGWNDGRDATE